jgi:hypothetical protein
MEKTIYILAAILVAISAGAIGISAYRRHRSFNYHQ